MNVKSAREKAERLKLLLGNNASSSKEANSLRRAISPLLERVILGEITSPLEWKDIPGDYLFDEGTLRNISGLEQAYAEFKIEVTGNAENDVLRWLREERKK